MSIWSSLGGPELFALDGSTDAANYLGEGQPNVTVDVATTSNHRLIRLALFDFGPETPVDVDMLLTADTARLLATRLTAAAEAIERRQ